MPLPFQRSDFLNSLVGLEPEVGGVVYKLYGCTCEVVLVVDSKFWTTKTDYNV